MGQVTCKQPHEIPQVDRKNVFVDGDVSVQGLVKLLTSGRATKVLVICGAGISTSANIPDFRTPGRSLLNLVRPVCIY